MKVVIIGAGVAGLSLGVYLQKSGISTVIYETQKRPGGLCTGWRRGDYSFNGCLHWLLGARPGSSFYQMWREIIDVDSLKFIDFEERVAIVLSKADGTQWVFHLYNNVQRLRNYLNTLSSEDADIINDWMSAIEMLVPLLTDLPPVINEPSIWDRVKHCVRLSRLYRMLPFLHKWGRLTTKTFADKFHNPDLSNAIRHIYTDEVPMSVVIMGQAYMAAQVAAYPIGGSEALIKKLVDSYRECGGSLELGMSVKRVLVKQGKAIGVELVNGNAVTYDFVCSAADWRWTMQTALEGAYTSRSQAQLMQRDKRSIYFSYFRMHIGIAQDLSSVPHFFRLPVVIDSPDGTHYDQIEVEVNNFDQTLAKPGKTTMSINFTTREGQWWIDIRESNRQAYEEAKRYMSNSVLSALSAMVGSQIDVSLIDELSIATPATYNRFTNNYLGSSQGWTPMRNQLRRLPIGPVVDGLDRFVMAGHWLEAGGGLPVALVTARRAASIICRFADK